MITLGDLQEYSFPRDGITNGKWIVAKGSEGLLGKGPRDAEDMKFFAVFIGRRFGVTDSSCILPKDVEPRAKRRLVDFLNEHGLNGVLDWRIDPVKDVADDVYFTRGYLASGYCIR